MPQPRPSPAPRPQSPHTGLFYLLAIGLTWLFWLPAALWAPPEPAGLTLALHYAGGAMPFLVALFLSFRKHTPAFRTDYWQRLFGFRRIRALWWAIILLLVPILTFLSAGIDRLLGGPGLVPEALTRLSSAPLWILPFLLASLVFGPLPEELAWRGYALDGLIRRFRPTGAALVTGLLWALWHLPLFWIEGSYQSSRREPFFFSIYLLNILVQAVVITWVYLCTRRSTLSAILIHWSINLVGELFFLSRNAELIFWVLWLGLAVAVLRFDPVFSDNLDQYCNESPLPG